MAVSHTGAEAPGSKTASKPGNLGRIRSKIPPQAGRTAGPVQVTRTISHVVMTSSVRAVRIDG